MSGERELSMPSVELSDAAMVKIEGGEVVTWAECKRRLAFRPARREAQPETDGGGEAWNALSPDEQFALATRIAANVGYELRPEPEHPDSPHRVHSDDLAVDRFAAAMKAKLAQKRAEGRGGWDDKEDCSAEFLSGLLRGHVEKGDPLDVGNLAMMLHQRGEGIVSLPQSDGGLEAGPPQFAMVWLNRGTYPASLVDYLNGYMTGGSGRCLEALEALGVTVMHRTAPTPEGQTEGALSADERFGIVAANIIAAVLEYRDNKHTCTGDVAEKYARRVLADLARKGV